jgi:hypothetical protein
MTQPTPEEQDKINAEGLQALFRLEHKRQSRERLERLIESGMDDPREDR